MEEDSQYASIIEVKKQAIVEEAAKKDGAGSPPPLPPPNRASGALRSSAASEEDIKTSTGKGLEPPIHTSSSSPHLSSMAGQDGGSSNGGGATPVYAVVKKPKKSPESKPNTPPPPLPPPLTLEDGDSNDGLILVPQYGSGGEAKPRRPVPLPRAHVYEVVPQEVVLQQQESHFQLKQSRKSSRKRKSKIEKEKRKSGGKTIAPLISLSDLEPLPSSGESMRLQEFVNRFSHYLPLRVKVDEGYCGTEERFVISSGDVYNFHFVKTEKVACIQDCGGARFSIPLNSSIEFGTLYNPNNDFKAALQGSLFKTVSELASCKQLPRVVCATRGHLTGESKTSVQAGEILVIKKIGRTTVMRKPVLKAFSVKSNEDKQLQEDCEGHFSTVPDQLRLYLPEILEHLSQFLPLETMLYMRSSEPSDDLPLHLTSDVVTLTHTAIESSIIASTCWEGQQEEELSDEDRALVAIPADLDIEVMFLGRESDDEQLYESTRCYFEKFRSLKIKDMKNSGGMQRGEGVTLAQKKLYKAVREGYEAQATEIKMPYRISGVFDGEVSPLARSLENRKELPNVTEVGVAVSPLDPAFSDKPSTAVTTDHLTPHLPPKAPHSVATRPLPDCTPPLPPSTHNSNVEDDLLNDDLGALYSAIDSIFDATMQSSDQPVSEVNNVKTTPKSSPRERRKIESRGNADSASTPVAPKPFPRTRSQTEMKLSSAEQGAQEVNGLDSNTRVMGFEELSKNYSQLQLEVQELRRELIISRELEAGYDVVQPPSLRVRKSMLAQRPVSIVKASNLQDQERNREDLRNLDHMEVITLLECMNLEQYREQFMQEQVDGEILAECSEVMLETDLKIHSAIHRTRLMKVISGRHSALSFLREGNELYSTLVHRT